MTNKEFAQWVYDAAKSLDIDPIFVTAQAALETGWGKSRIGKYNLFGITKGTWTGRTQLVKTREVHSTANYAYFAPEKVISVEALPSGRYRYIVMRLFRDYDTLEQCLEDYIAIFKKPHFAHAWCFRHDGAKFADAIQSGRMKYATDPKYNSILKSVMNTIKGYVNE